MNITKKLLVFFLVFCFSIACFAELQEHIQGMHSSPTSSGADVIGNNSASETNKASADLASYFLAGILQPVADYFFIPILTPFFPILAARYNRKKSTPIGNSTLTYNHYFQASALMDKSITGQALSYQYKWVQAKVSSINEDSFNTQYSELNFQTNKIHRNRHLFRFLVSLRYVASDFKDSFAMGVQVPYEYFIYQELSLLWQPNYYIYNPNAFVAEYILGLNYYINSKNQVSFVYEYKNLARSKHDLDFFSINYRLGF